MKRIALSLSLLVFGASAYAAVPQKAVVRKPAAKSIKLAPKPAAKVIPAPTAAPIVNPVVATPAPAPTPALEVASPTPAPVVESPTPEPQPLVATASLEALPVAATVSVPVVEVKPATPSLEALPVVATVSVPVVEVKPATPSLEAKPLAAATASLAITSAKVEKTGGSFPLDFSKLPTVPRLGLKFGYDWGNGTEAHRYNYGITGANPEISLNSKDLAGKQYRLDWSVFGLGVGAALAGYTPGQAVWPNQTQDLYLTLPGLRAGYRTETFADTLSGAIPEKSISTWFGGLYSDGPLLIDLLRFGYDVNLGAGQWKSNQTWHLSGNGEAFLGLKLDFIGIDMGYRYGLTSGTTPADLSPLTMISGLLGIGDKPQVNMGTNQGPFIRTKLYW